MLSISSSSCRLRNAVLVIKEGLTNMYKGFVFDLDGTLVDSLPGLTEGLNRALKAQGYPPYPAETVATMVGKGARELCRSALKAFRKSKGEVSDDDVMCLYAEFGREYPHTWQGGTTPFEGIIPMLRELADGGARLAVLSNKPHDVTRPLVLDKLPGIPLDPILGFSSEFPRKPDPSSLFHIIESWGLTPADVCMVGDSAHDGNTAVNAGTGLVLVDWGYSTRDALESFRVPVCESVAELRSILVGSRV